MKEVMLMFLKKFSPSVMEEKMIVNLIKLISELIRLISSIINLVVFLLKNKNK